MGRAPGLTLQAGFTTPLIVAMRGMISFSEASRKLLEFENWSPEGDAVALRKTTFIRRLQPGG